MVTQIARRNTFGICPRCNSKLFLLNSIYELYVLSENGWVSSKIDKHVVSKVICKPCGFKHDMKITIDGLVPIGYEGNNNGNGILKPNPLGKVDE